MLDALLGPRQVIVNLDKREYMDPDQFGDDSSVDKFCLEKDGGVIQHSILFDWERRW